MALCLPENAHFETFSSIPKHLSGYTYTGVAFLLYNFMHMINPEIAKYISEERKRGVTDADIQKALAEKGWKESDIKNAFKAQVAIAHVGGLFKGRLDKGNFLKIVLVGMVVQFIISELFGGSIALGMMSGYGMLGFGMFGFFIMGVVSLIIGIYELGATVRRLHDIGQTGWYALGLVVVSMIPFLGWIISIAALIYLCMTPGDIKENTYGDVPNPNITLWQAIAGIK